MYDGGAPLTGYYIYYLITGTSVWSKTPLISYETFEYTLNNLTPNNPYSIKIDSANIKGESDFSHV